MPVLSTLFGRAIVAAAAVVAVLAATVVAAPVASAEPGLSVTNPKVSTFRDGWVHVGEEFGIETGPAFCIVDNVVHEGPWAVEYTWDGDVLHTGVTGKYYRVSVDEPGAGDVDGHITTGPCAGHSFPVGHLRSVSRHTGVELSMPDGPYYQGSVYTFTATGVDDDGNPLDGNIRVLWNGSAVTHWASSPLEYTGPAGPAGVSQELVFEFEPSDWNYNNGSTTVTYEPSLIPTTLDVSWQGNEPGSIGVLEVTVDGNGHEVPPEALSTLSVEAVGEPRAATTTVTGINTADVRFSTDGLPAGGVPVTVVLPPYGHFDASEGNTTVTIDAIDAHMTVTANSVEPWGPFDIAVQVDTDDGPAAAGTVAVYDTTGSDRVNVGSAGVDIDGHATVTVTPTGVGARTFDVEYASGLYQADPRTFDVEVQPLDTIIDIHVGPGGAGLATTVAGSVNETVSGEPVTGGEVRLTEDGAVVSVGSVDSDGSYVLEYTPKVGERVLDVDFDPTVEHLNPSSTTTTHTASPTPSTLTIDDFEYTSPAPGTDGTYTAPVCLATTASVDPALITGSDLTATLTLADGTTHHVADVPVSWSTPHGCWAGTIADAGLVAGEHALTIAMDDNDYLTPSPTTETFDVDHAVTDVTVHSSGPAAVGRTRTYTATLSEVVPGHTHTEPVTFTDGDTVLGTAAVIDGTATITVTPSSAGALDITAEYPGDDVHGAANSDVDSTTIGRGTATIDTAISPARVVAERPTTLTATVVAASDLAAPALGNQIASLNTTPVPRFGPFAVAAAGATIPAEGDITFEVDGQTVATVPLVDGTASATVVFPDAGTRVVTVSYTGSVDLDPIAHAAATAVDVEAASDPPTPNDPDQTTNPDRTAPQPTHRDGGTRHVHGGTGDAGTGAGRTGAGPGGAGHSSSAAGVGTLARTGSDGTTGALLAAALIAAGVVVTWAPTSRRRRS